ncbi:basic proline-rich protein-like [Iris pallida]|uniref:Basic proline-rich protein-like n=1 Tax=Iris pallida TaxID=29817 RepID=A0AAX6GAF1_IRIPA|nr:basic proline-rich protein-like [Iris pallida]
MVGSTGFHPFSGRCSHPQRPVPSRSTTNAATPARASSGGCSQLPSAVGDEAASCPTISAKSGRYFLSHARHLTDVAATDRSFASARRTSGETPHNSSLLPSLLAVASLSLGDSGVLADRNLEIDSSCINLINCKILYFL